MYIFAIQFIINKIFLLKSYIMTLPLQHTFGAIVAGPSRAGKSWWIKKLIEYRESMITPKPDKVYYCYSEWQPLFNSYADIEFHQGIIDIEQIDRNVRNLIIIDDLISDINQKLEDIFTKHSHHRNVSIIFITQNLFQKGSHMRTMSLNASYIVLFKNPRDINQVNFLARQMFPPKQSNFLQQAFRDATSIPFGYLFIDLKQETEELLRIRTGIFPDEKTYIYMPQKISTSLQRYNPLSKEV